MLRNLEIGFDTTLKTYAKAETAEKKAREIAEHCYGMVNVRIVPVERDGVIRYSALFSNFELLSPDGIFVARAGFMAFA